ncbi:ABC transporter transmembrane domain-containing protein [Nonomuraea sp. NPDC050547]|uniref:ABC transporter transmembrane domain-containing protein n=1 Tax=Nonomuraea sp. NPDC050547 TaxID=3364368 RepID=UPI0037920A96
MRSGDRLVLDAVRRSGPWPLVLAFTATAAAAAELALPYLIGRTIDGQDRTTWLTAAVGAVAVIMVCESLSVWTRGVSGAAAAARMRGALMRRVLGVGPGMTRRFGQGDLVTRAGLNAEELGGAPDAAVSVITLLVPTVGGLVALTLIDPRLTLTLAAGLVAIMFVLRAFMRASGEIAAAYQETQGEIATRLVDALAGARTIAAAGTEEREVRRVLTPLPTLRTHGLALWRATAGAGVRAGIMVPVLEVAVLAMGGFLLASRQITVGDLYAAARYAVLGAALSGALGFVARLARARAAADRVAEVMDEREAETGAATLPAGDGTVEFRAVTAGGLEVGDLVLPGGSVTAVVGRSGAGKSALAALAGRLTDPDRGTVSLDGVNLRELSPSALRQAVAYAFERPVLLGETVEEAIEFGRAPAGAAEGAARAARADGFLSRLPQGFLTPLERAPMSGGERQRVGLARAFAQGGRFLVLDDATSGLDTLTEQQVGEALTGELGGRTRLVVTHRAATAARADRVIWLDGGRVRGHAPHASLWKDPGYRAVFEHAGVAS